MNKYLNLTAALFASVTMSMFGQNILSEAPQYDGIPYRIPTPEASKLGQFGNVPVSQYHGTADIRIPIYSTEQRGIFLDVNLQYDTSGFLINQLPGWTGHGWTLNAGGRITRKVNRLEDEIRWVGQGDPWNSFQNYFMAYSNNTDEGLAQYITPVDSYHFSPNAYKIYMNNADVAPDIFYFNFMGYSGRFFLGCDGQWKVLSDNNIDVVFDISDDSNFIYPFIQQFPINGYNQYLPKTIKGFTLVDENGIRYVFGGTTDAIEYSIDMMHTTKDVDAVAWTADSWMLTEVQDRFGNTLYSFHYSRDKFLVQLSNVKYAEAAYINVDNSCYTAFSGYSTVLNAPVSIEYIACSDGRKIQFNRSSAFPNAIASRILYPNTYIGDISYFYNTANGGTDVGAYHYLQSSTYSEYQSNPNVNKIYDPLSSMDMPRLDEISVSVLTDTIQKYRLHYGYNTRMHLDSITVSSPKKKMGTYSFVYNNYSQLPSDYLTQKFDHWGYYNGNNNSTMTTNKQLEYMNTIMESDSIDEYVSTFNNSMLQPNTTTSQYGMLQSIRYPTGGCTVLEYEQNTYSKYLSENRQTVNTLNHNNITGGLRIKSITDYNDYGCQELLTKREYIYSDTFSGISSGVLYAMPNAFCVWDTDIFTHQGGGYNLHGYIATSMVNSILPLSNSFGPHIGYSHVIEKYQDNSYITSKFSSMADYSDCLSAASAMSCLYSDWTPYDKFGERGYLQGKTLQRQFYDPTNTLMKHEVYVYNTDEGYNSNHYVWNNNIGSHSLASPYSCFTGQIYKMFYPKISTITKVERTLMNNQWLCDSTVYTWGDYKIQITEDYLHYAIFRKCGVETIYRGESELQTKYYYAKAGATAINGGSGLLRVQEQQDFTEEEMRGSYFTPLIGKSRYIDGTFIGSHRIVYGYFNNKYLPKYEMKYVGNFDNPDTLLTYNTYTSRQLPSMFTDEQGVSTKLKWNARNQLQAIVRNMYGNWKLVLANPDSVASTVNDEFFGSKPVSVTIAKYNTIGLPVRITQGSNIVTYYDYNSMGWLVNVRDVHGNVMTNYKYQYQTGDLIDDINIFDGSSGILLPD